MKFFNRFKIIKPAVWLFIVGGALANTLFLYNASFFLINHTVPFGDDSTTLIQVSSIFNGVMFDRYKSPDPDKLLLINTSYDHQLVNYYDELAGSGDIPITSRPKLLKLLKTINDKNVKYQYILCDIAFIEETPLDTALASEMGKLKIVIPYDIDEKENLLYPNATFKDINKGLSHYQAAEDIFVKFTYNQQKHKSIPVKMYEDIHGKNYSYEDGDYLIDGQPVMNNSVLNFRLRYFDIMNIKKYKIINLGNLLQLPDDILKQYLANKLIVLGDFVAGDMHQTVVGDMSGPVLLLNAYYALVNGDNIITSSFRVFLIAGFFILSFAVFLPPKVINWKVPTTKKEKLRNLIKTKLLTSMITLVVISLLSYIFFGIHVNILLLFFYMVALQFIVRMVYKRQIIST